MSTATLTAGPSCEPDHPPGTVIILTECPHGESLCLILGSGTPPTDEAIAGAVPAVMQYHHAVVVGCDCEATPHRHYDAVAS